MQPIQPSPAQPLAARMWAILLLIGGIAGIAASPLAEGLGIAPLVPAAIGGAAVLIGLFAWRQPPERWTPATILLLPVVAFGLIAVGTFVTHGTIVEFGLLYGVVFATIGATYRRGTPLGFGALVGSAWTAQLAAFGGFGPTGVASIVLPLIACVGVGEAIAWLTESRRLAQGRLHAELADDLVRSLVQAATDATIVVDEAGLIQFVSPSARATLGYDPDELVGTAIQSLVSGDAAPSMVDLGHSIAPGSSTRVECGVTHKDGRSLTVEVVATNLREERGLVLMLHDVTKWKALEEQLTRQAFSDPLTGLANRALYIDRLGHALGRRRHHVRGPAVLFLDLDDFKTVNDTLGHVEGDRLIRLVADRLNETIRPEDTAARLGGDEFAILLEDVDENQAVAVAMRVLAALERPFELSDRMLRTGGSVGIALASPELPQATDMLRAADIAMYSAKDEGKGRYRLFEPAMQAATVDRLRLSVDLRGALERGEFVLHYQPTVLLPSGDITGMEALVRWAHPERGLIPPLDFIPLAERTGLIIPLGEFILRSACRQARAWQLARPGQPPLMLSVNLSGVQVRDPGLVAAVSLALEDSQLPPEMLTLEITESVMATETETVIRRLRQLKGLGVGLAIDDFGTGYSSLSYLRRFPIDMVKIDKSFVDGIATGTDDMVLARAIVRLAHSLKIKTVAEGVELEGQVKRLSKMGSDQAQGFYFSRPMDVEHATAHLVGHTTLSLWVGHSGHELDVIKSVVADFEVLNPGIKIEVTGAVSDDRIMVALESGVGPNVVSSFESDNFGIYSSDAGLIDLGPHMERDGISDSLLTDATKGYTRRNGKRWALPMLADTYGLYVNRQTLGEASLAGAPRTTSELTAWAQELTRRNPDGSLKVVGFNPMIGFYENSVAVFGHMFGARWTDELGRSSIATDPAWARMFTWQRELVDWFGVDDLLRFEEEAGREFTATNAFQAGRLGMVIDGEWRVAFIAGQAPKLQFGAWPVPVADGLAEHYGSGYINGSVIGIPARAGQQRESWKLVKYLATDDRALAKLSNGLRNVPTTKSALSSPDLIPDANFAVFLDIFAHPESSSTAVTAIGSAYQAVLTNFATEWQAGRVPDLQTGLEDVDTEIDALVRQATGGLKRVERPAA